MALQERLEHEIRKVDDTGRLSLGVEKIGVQYEVTEAVDGTLTMVPVTIIPTRELWLHQNPEAMAMVDEGLAALGRGERGVAIELPDLVEG